jgi:hypothetical protein
MFPEHLDGAPSIANKGNYICRHRSAASGQIGADQTWRAAVVIRIAHRPLGGDSSSTAWGPGPRPNGYLTTLCGWQAAHIATLNMHYSLHGLASMLCLHGTYNSIIYQMHRRFIRIGFMKAAMLILVLRGDTDTHFVEAGAVSAHTRSSLLCARCTMR